LGEGSESAASRLRRALRARGAGAVVAELVLARLGDVRCGAGEEAEGGEVRT